MDSDFWHQKWERNETAFHGDDAHPLLVAHFQRLALGNGSRVFLPLCGKTLDISWLLSLGCRVAGAELSKLAVAQLFSALELEPKISGAGPLEHYAAPGIDIFAGDIFALQRHMLGPVDAVYDRAALVALPEAMRKRYTAHLIEISAAAPQLLISMEYDQSLTEGPPFSVDAEEVNSHYKQCYEIILLENRSVPGGLKGRCEASESVWLLNR